MRVPKSKLIKKADLLFGQLIRARGSCQHCGGTKNLQCAHIISRTNKNLRWNPDNALCLDLKCHLYWAHRSPLEFADWFQTNFPIQYAFLMKEKNKINPDVGSSLEFTIKELQEKLKDYV